MSIKTGTIKGTVYWNNSEKLIAHDAIVYAVSGETQKWAHVGDKGEYSFEELDPAVSWTLFPIHYDGKAAARKSKTFSDTDDGETKAVEVVDLFLERTVGEHSWIAGIGSFTVLIFLAGFLFNAYWKAHDQKYFPAEPVSNTTKVNQSTTAKKKKTSIEVVRSEVIQLLQSSDTMIKQILVGNTAELVGFSGKLREMLNKINSDHHFVSTQTELAIRNALNELEEEAKSIAEKKEMAVAEGTKFDTGTGAEKKVKAAVVELKGMLETLEVPYLWTAWPWFLIELWCWGLLGVLVQKVVRIGWYLRIKRYYSVGTWMHSAQVLTTPILAVIATLVISSVEIKTGGGGSIGIQSPQAMVVTSFLLSLIPWALWDFLVAKSKNLTTAGGK